MSVRVVLVEPSHPGNIGSVARAMGNMGFADLRLVRSVEHRVEAARVRAAGSEAILANAVVTDSLAGAIGDCSMIVGTSARVRSVDWPTMTPREAMARVVNGLGKSQKTAILFGPERTGLCNRHIDQCDLLVRIPVSERLPSINLAGAVLIVLYELHLVQNAQNIDESVSHAESVLKDDEEWATHRQIEGYFTHLQSVLERIEFIAESPREILMRKIRRIFLHPGLSEDEVNILRGILSAVERKTEIRSASNSE